MNDAEHDPPRYTVDEETYAEALAAAGVIGARRSLDVPDPSAEVRAALNNPDAAVPWRLPISPGEVQGSPLGDRLAEFADAWRGAFGAVYRVGLQVEPDPWQARMSPTSLVRVLDSVLHGAEANPVFFRLRGPSPAGLARWQWPLTLSFLDDPESINLYHQLLDAHYVRDRKLARLQEPGQTPDPGGVLIVPHGLREVARRLSQTALPVNAVMLMADADEPPGQVRPLVRAIQQHTRARSVGVFHVDGARRADWLDSLTIELSHDEGLDRALTAAQRHSDGPPPLLYADPAFLNETRMIEVVRSLNRRLPRDLLIPPDLGFLREMDGGEMARERKAGLPPELPEPRFLQAAVYDSHVAQRRRRLRRAFRAGHRHDIEVWIGPQSLDALTASAPFPEDPRGGPQELTVVFEEDRRGARRQEDRIELPPVGSSKPCHFTLKVGRAASRVAARVTVYRGTAVAQVMLLDGPVVAAGARPRRGERITWLVESISGMRPGSEASPQPDASFVVSRQNGKAAAAAKAGDTLWSPKPAGFDKALQNIQTLLSRLITHPERYADVDAKDWVDLLQYLAIHGANLFDGVVRGTDMRDRLVAADRIQVVGVNTEEYLPVEFFYDRPRPKRGSGLCPSWRDALDQGACVETCPHEDALNAYVCPLGFWCTRKVIESHLSTRRVELAGDRYEFAVEPTPEDNRLALTNGALLAASSKVDGFEAGGIERVASALKALAGDRATLATTWDGWPELIGEVRPELLVLMPHTYRDQQDLDRYLEIGVEQALGANDLSGDYVRYSEDARPLVLLLGCDTAEPTSPFDGFPAKFRDWGAAIVVGTLTEVLGRDASKVASQLVTALAAHGEASEEATFGEVMRTVRRHFLRDGKLPVLALVAFGHADWKVGSALN